jgi:hypothetical protein
MGVVKSTKYRLSPGVCVFTVFSAIYNYVFYKQLYWKITGWYLLFLYEVPAKNDQKNDKRNIRVYICHVV